MDKYSSNKVLVEREIAQITGEIWNSLFIKCINEASVSTRRLAFIMFKGDSDPNEHIMYIQQAVILYNNNDAIMCKLFMLMLKHVTNWWLDNLEKVVLQDLKTW